MKSQIGQNSINITDSYPSKNQVAPLEYSDDDEIDKFDTQNNLQSLNAQNEVEENPDNSQEDVSINMTTNLQKVIDELKDDNHGLSRSKSEDWGCTQNKNSEVSMNAIKPHYTEGDLSNIELVEEDSEGEESEGESEIEMISGDANGITIAGT